MLKPALFGLVLCAAMFGHAHAATPRFDTEGYCRSTVMSEGPFTQEKYDYCIKTEHAARGMMGRYRASAALIDRCTQVARSNRDGTTNQGSYGVLVTCLEGKQGLNEESGQAPR